MAEKRALTLREILSSIDGNYLRRIMERIGSMTLRAQIGSSRMEPWQIVRGYLSEKRVATGIYRSLSKEAYEIASLIIASGGSLSADAVNARSDPQKYRKAVNECVEKLALFLMPDREHPLTVCVPVEYMIMGVVPDNTAGQLSLIAALGRYDSNSIREMGRTLGLECDGKAPANAADVFSCVFGSREELVRTLDKADAEVLEWMFARNGLAFPEDFAERFYPKASPGYHSHLSYDYDFMGTRHRHSTPAPHSILFLKGLLAESPAANEWDSTKVVTMPDEIYELFLDKRAAVSNDRRGKPDILRQGPLKPVDAENGFFMMLRKVAVALVFGSRRNRKPGVPVLSELSGCDEYHTSLILNFFDISRLFAEESEGIESMDPKEAVFALFSKPDALVGHVLRYFLIPPPEHATEMKTGRPTLIPLILHRILSRLSGSTDAVSVSSLISMLTADNALILASRAQHLEQMERERFERMLNREKGGRAELSGARIVENIALSVLKNLYLVYALSSDREPVDTGAFVSLSAFGRSAMSGIPEESLLAGLTEKRSSLIVQPDLEIMADIFTNLRDLETLSAFSEEVHIDRLCRFRVTRKSITASVNAGTAPENIRNFLAERSSSGIPATLDRMLSDVNGKIGEIKVIRCQAIIRTKDKFMTEELVRKKSLSKYLGGRVADDIILVKEGTSLRSFLNSMKKAGYVPQSED